MDKELLNQALKVLFESLASGKEFVLEHAPDVVQQLLLYTQVSNGIIAFVCALVPVLFFYLMKKGNKEEWDEVGMAFLSALGGFISVGAVLACIDSTLTFLKVTFAPKLFLLEYAADLVK